MFVTYCGTSINIVLLCHRIVTLSNRADVAVHFEWKSVASEEEEQLQKEMLVF